MDFPFFQTPTDPRSISKRRTKRSFFPTIFPGPGWNEFPYRREDEKSVVDRMEQFYGIAIRQAGASCSVAKDKIDGNDTPALPWVEAQQDRIQGFTAYGPAFQ